MGVASVDVDNSHSENGTYTSTEQHVHRTIKHEYFQTINYQYKELIAYKLCYQWCIKSTRHNYNYFSKKCKRYRVENVQVYKVRKQVGWIRWTGVKKYRDKSVQMIIIDGDIDASLSLKGS